MKKETQKLNRFGRTEKEQKEFSRLVGEKIYMNRCDGILNTFYSETPVRLLELCKEYLENLMVEESATIESIIAENIKPFPKENFLRFSDKSHLDSISNAYFKKDGTPIDVQAQGLILDFHLQIDEKDLIEEIVLFCVSYRINTYISPGKLKMMEIVNEFRSITGFEPKDYYCNHLINVSLGINEQIDTKEEADCPF
jgi:hypothetical protein